MTRFIRCWMLICILPTILHARPVSYPGGWTLMQKNSGDVSSLHFHYSPSARHSVGPRSEYWSDDKFWLHSIAVNTLVKRWNRPASQANLYFKSGVGFAYSDEGDFDNEYEPLGYAGLAADWEDRRFFVGHEFRMLYADQIDKSFHQSAKVGVAPYVGEYGDIHTWIMIKLDHHPGSDDTFTFTPMLRFFKDVYLLETGVSDRGDLLLNFIIRF